MMIATAANVVDGREAQSARRANPWDGPYAKKAGKGILPAAPLRPIGMGETRPGPVHDRTSPRNGEQVIDWRRRDRLTRLERVYFKTRKKALGHTWRGLAALSGVSSEKLKSSIVRTQADRGLTDAEYQAVRRVVSPQVSEPWMKKIQFEAAGVGERGRDDEDERAGLECLESSSLLMVPFRSCLGMDELKLEGRLNDGATFDHFDRLLRFRSKETVTLTVPTRWGSDEVAMRICKQEWSDKRLFQRGFELWDRDCAPDPVAVLWLGQRGGYCEEHSYLNRKPCRACAKIAAARPSIALKVTGHGCQSGWLDALVASFFTALVDPATTRIRDVHFALDTDIPAACAVLFEVPPDGRSGLTAVEPHDNGPEVARGFWLGSGWKKLALYDKLAEVQAKVAKGRFKYRPRYAMAWPNVFRVEVRLKPLSRERKLLGSVDQLREWTLANVFANLVIVDTRRVPADTVLADTLIIARRQGILEDNGLREAVVAGLRAGTIPHVDLGQLAAGSLGGATRVVSQMPVELPRPGRKRRPRTRRRPRFVHRTDHRFGQSVLTAHNGSRVIVDTKTIGTGAVQSHGFLMCGCEPAATICLAPSM